MSALCRLAAIACLAGLTAMSVHGQARDQNAPYKDGYDALHGDDLVGEWEGTVTGSSVSQGSGRIGGRAIFVRRGYEGRDIFALVLHDELNRSGMEFSEISIGNIACGPENGRTSLVHTLEFRDAPSGAASMTFNNMVADTRRPDLLVSPGYGPTLEQPARLETSWTDDSFNLSVSGRMRSFIVPARNGLIDWESDLEPSLEHLNLNLQFELPRTPETEEFYQSTLCRETERFEVVDTTPNLGKENVLLSGAEFDFVFSEDLYEGSLRSVAIDFETLGANGFPIKVEAEYSLVDSKTLRVIPVEPLLPGTIYEIVIKPGRYGIVGVDGETLEEHFVLPFSTMVDPENLRLDIYQVSRNATLVNGKPAAARLYVDWEERSDVAPDYQVKSYPVEIEIRDKRDNLIFPKRTKEAIRPDQFTDEDRRLGLDSLNIFGWSPTSSRQPDEFIAHVLPYDYYPEDVELEPETVEREMEYAGQHVDRLTVDYFIAVHSQWLPDGPDEAAVTQVMQSMNMERAFANQVFPVARVSASYRGTYNIADTICAIPGMSVTVCKDGFVRRPWGTPVGLAEDGKWSTFLSLFYEHVGAMSSADILVSFHPPMDGGGQASSRFEQPDGLKVEEGGSYGNIPDAPQLVDLFDPEGSTGNVIAMSTGGFRAGNRAAVFTAPLIVHEIGHNFSLPHIPYARDEDHRAELCKAGLDQTAASIDGMRIALDGGSGATKSSQKGNAESTYPLLNLMFPCIYEPRRRYWIDDEQYEWLVERMPSMLRMVRARLASVAPSLPPPRQADRNPLLWQASFWPLELAKAQDWIMVSGIVDGDASAFLPVVSVSGPRNRLSAEHGSYEIRVEDAQGRVLASTSAGPDGNIAPGATSWPFAVRFPISGKPERIVLSREGRVLTERRALEDLAPPQVTSHQAGSIYRAGDRLEWQSKADAGRLSYTVRFSPDGEDWSTLAVLLPEPYFTPDPATLAPGSNAAFEIIVQDGVGQQSTYLPVSIELPLKPLATLPAASGAEDEGMGAELLFNVELDAETLGGVRLLGPSGQEVPGHVRLDPSGMTVMISPAGHGSAGRYTAIVPTSLRALDGRTLDRELQLPFRMSTQAPALPEAASAIAKISRDRPERAPAPRRQDTPSAPARQPAGPVGEGEITLELGQPLTLPARILSCNAGTDQSSVEIDFETDPGARQLLRVERSQSGEISLSLDQGKAREITSSGTGGADWALNIENGTVSGRVIIADRTMKASVRFSGACPAG